MAERINIEHLATLARIKLTESEQASLGSEIESILGYVDQIKAVSAQAIPDIAIPQALNVLREDIPRSEGGEYTNDLIDTAPYHEENSVKVKNMF